MQIHTDCRHYRGDLPCEPHKREGVHCEGCAHYAPVSRRILIIKLGAIGDVIRTTPLLRRLKANDPACEVSWLTHTPEILPRLVDRVHPFTLSSIVALQGMSFDVLYNLDKDREACSLAMQLAAKEKIGFGLENGKCVPLNEAAREKWLTGLFDDVSRANKKSYQQEIFEICGGSFSGEDYLLEKPAGDPWPIAHRTAVVGLNTGCGARWPSRLWPEKSWAQLARRLKKAGYAVVLLGGPDEHERNRRLAKVSGAKYFGHFPLERFISLVDQCDLVVTAVTMAMHLAIGLRKKLILFNNIFNRHEFELYGRGVVLEPEQSCRCFYQPACTQPQFCMTTLPVETVFSHCRKFLSE
ncbi:MAG: glycosyltransferase family 9 protein [Nitrospirae bacterium]|nr:glycosyltransferase family 9 protein [Nitrospirota bacterium]